MSSANVAPNYRTGKVCYLEIPATDIAVSAEFYARVFNWQVRERGDGAVAFDDPVGGVSGTWVLGRQPAPANLGIAVSILA